MLKFCGRCGAKFIQKSERLFICQNCGFNYYIAPASCNGLILENPRGEILLAKRKFAPYKDYWDLPGGFIDMNETVEESIVREIKEELGIVLKNFQYFRSYHDQYLYTGVKYKTLGLIFTAKIDNQEIKPADDITEVKFFSKAKIPWKKLAFRNVKKALEDYLKKN